MKTYISLISIIGTLIFFNLVIYSQFRITIGNGNPNTRFFINSITETPQGDFVAVGQCNAPAQGGDDFYVVKFTSTGSLIWAKTYGYMDLYNDFARSIVIGTGGNYYVGGLNNTWNGSSTIVKLAPDGQMFWYKTYSLLGSGIYSMCKTSDGAICATGYAMGDTTGNDFLVMKFNYNGDVIWTKLLSLNPQEIAYSIVQSTDGGFAIGGVSGGIPVLFKVNQNGDFDWGKYCGPTSAGGLYTNSVIQTTDGGYAFTGVSYVIAYQDLFAGKVNSSGGLEWYKQSTNGAIDAGRSIVQMNDGSFVVAGKLYGLLTNYDYLLMRFSSIGVLQSAVKFGSGSLDEMIYGCKTSEGGIIMAGYNPNAIYQTGNGLIVKADSNLNLCIPTTSVSIPLQTLSSLQSFNMTSLPVIPVIAQQVAQVNTVGSITADCVFGIAPVNGELPTELYLRQNYPNPFNPSTEIEFGVPISAHVQLDLYDVSGKLVKLLVDQFVQPGEYSVSFEASNLPSGAYFYRITIESNKNIFSATRKMVVLK